MRHGATVAVMDWDSHRYLESYFAIPMMGATLFTVNVRLAPHQIAYALNDSEAEIVLVHADFVPMLEAIKGELTSVREVVVLADGQAVPTTTWRGRGRIRGARRAGVTRLRIRRLRREHQGRHLLHQRHDRRSEGCLLQPPPDRAAHDGDRDDVVRAACGAAHPSRGRVHADHADVPCARVGHPVRRVDARPEDRAAGPIPARGLARAEASPSGSRSRTACRPFCRCCCRRPTRRSRIWPTGR